MFADATSSVLQVNAAAVTGANPAPVTMPGNTTSITTAAAAGSDPTAAGAAHIINMPAPEHANAAIMTPGAVAATVPTLPQPDLTASDQPAPGDEGKSAAV